MKFETVDENGRRWLIRIFSRIDYAFGGPTHLFRGESLTIHYEIYAAPKQPAIDVEITVGDASED